MSFSALQRKTASELSWELQVSLPVLNSVFLTPLLSLKECFKFPQAEGFKFPQESIGLAIQRHEKREAGVRIQKSSETACPSHANQPLFVRNWA